MAGENIGKINNGEMKKQCENENQKKTDEKKKKSEEAWRKYVKEEALIWKYRWHRRKIMAKIKLRSEKPVTAAGVSSEENRRKRKISMKQAKTTERKRKLNNENILKAEIISQLKQQWKY